MVRHELRTRRQPAAELPPPTASDRRGFHFLLRGMPASSRRTAGTYSSMAGVFCIQSHPGAKGIEARGPQVLAQALALRS